jgi:excisionase family DNA binding protein
MDRRDAVSDNYIAPEAYTVETFCKIFGVGRSFTYELFKAGTLRPVKAGRRTLIPADQARDWFRSLQSSAGSAQQAA